MKRVNWNNVEKSGKKLKSKIKNLKATGVFLQERPGEGYYIDNISKKEVSIQECKSSTLRRFLKQVDKFYYLVSSQADREYLLCKKLELEKELSTREDGFIIQEG